jgi:hypothetical protein
MKRLEIPLLTILGGFAAGCLFLSGEYNSTAALFPRIIAVASLLFLFLTRIEGKMADGGRRIADVPEANPTSAIRNQTSAVLALQAAYMVLIYLIGFFVATVLYLAVAPLQLRYERRGVAVITSVAMTLALAGSFTWLFSIQLPTGAIWELW